MMMKINRLGNLLVVKVLDTDFVLRVHSFGVEAYIVTDGVQSASQEVPATGRELLEVTCETLLEMVLNELFLDLEEGTDELVDALQDEVQGYLVKLVQEGSNAPRFVC
ncbi:hypothetical protein SAMN04488137_1004 [Fictibacillus solisalsi]|uniref:Uncharacterized protein n=1 Tax=Fictibacillus solisalsi TaxID=459525 RepID=A0A1G9UM14_9BACL|nr:hypothetical protein [Fictibacillus solisalsi]SDM60874.1 hypothetical protein SAMN04488137_1004 [Fictibacillus solisalsi]